MSGATYICQIGCMCDCRHGVPCVIFRVDAEHPHPKRHIGFDSDGMAHEWRGDKGKGRCDVSAVDE